MAEIKQFLTLEDVESKADVEYATINVPEWGGTMRIGTLSAHELVEFGEGNKAASKTAGIRLIVQSIVDDNGNRIGDMRHIAMLQKKSAKVIARVVESILKLNDMLPETPADKTAGEKAGNASSEVPTGASLTD